MNVTRSSFSEPQDIVYVNWKRTYGEPKTENFGQIDVDEVVRT